MRISFQELLDQGKIVIADGGMGTLLFELGLTQGDSPELWNVEEPEKIRGIHDDYIKAGAQIILTNTFGCNGLRLELHKLSSRSAELNTAAAKLAITAAEAADKPVVVAGDIGPSGSIIVPLGDTPYEDLVAAFEVQAKALVEAGVDVLWIETMSAIEEVRAVVEACQNVVSGFPLITTMTFDTNGRTMMGITPADGLSMMKELGVVALGGNCGNGPDEIIGVIGEMRASDPDMLLVAKANAGIPHLEKGVAVYDGTPKIMADYAIKVRNLGAQVIGACCGSSPEHIRVMRKALDDTPFEAKILSDYVVATPDSTEKKSRRRGSRARLRGEK